MYWNTWAWTQHWGVWETEPLRLVAKHPEATYSKNTSNYSHSEGKVSYQRPSDTVSATNSGSLFHSAVTLKWLLLKTAEARIRLFREALPKEYVLQWKGWLLDSSFCKQWTMVALCIEEGALWNLLLLTWERRNFKSWWVTAKTTTDAQKILLNDLQNRYFFSPTSNNLTMASDLLSHMKKWQQQFSRSPIFVWKFLLALCEQCVIVVSLFSRGPWASRVMRQKEYAGRGAAACRITGMPGCAEATQEAMWGTSLALGISGGWECINYGIKSLKYSFPRLLFHSYYPLSNLYF